MAALAHLATSTRTVAEQSDDERIAYVAEDRWIDYPRASQALAELEWLLGSPERTRMPGLLIHGESNIGKSMILARFLRDRPPRQFNAATGLLETEVLAVQMPPAPQERRLYGQLLRALGAPYRPGDRLAVVESVALTLLGKVAPRMIVVDEVHNLLAGSAREQRASLNLLKFLSNEIKCVIVTLGTRDALVAMQTDAQIASRFPPFELPRWQENEDFRGFIAGFERHLPLRQPSRLADSRAAVSLVMAATGGITGSVTTLLSRAAVAAIRSQKEHITIEILEAMLRRARR